MENLEELEGGGLKMGNLFRKNSKKQNLPKFQNRNIKINLLLLPCQVMTFLNLKSIRVHCFTVL